MRHTAKSNLLNETEINKYLPPSLLGNPDLPISWQYYNLLITASSKDFLMYLMKFLQNSSQAFLNVKCWLQLLIGMILKFQ